MADVVIVGDGPGGLSAALFLAKNGLDVVLFGKDDTAMNWAYLYNYLGLPEISGTEFQRVARAQVEAFGAELADDAVDAITAANGGFDVRAASGRTVHARFVVLSEGKNPRIAPTLGLATGDDGLVVDRWGRTSRDGVYAVGRMVRPGRSQAIVSAGDGAAAAIDILAVVKDTPRFADWDSPPKEP